MEAIKMDYTGSVLIRAGSLCVWVDVWAEADGSLVADWNQYIFHLDIKQDVEIKAFQEDSNNFDEASSLAISYYEQHNTPYTIIN